MPLLPSTAIQINIISFNYENLPAVDAAALRAQAVRIRKLVKTTTVSIIEAGRALIAVKEQLDHGKFSAWVDAECGFSLRTAENYIRACQFAEGKSATVAFLNPATVYRLAAKGAPADIVEAVMQRAAKGDVVSDDDVVLLLQQAQRVKREANKRKRSAKRRAEAIRRWKNDHHVDFDEDQDDDEASEQRTGFLVMSYAARQKAQYQGPIDDEVIDSARKTAAAWCQLLESLETSAKTLEPKRAVG